MIYCSSCGKPVDKVPEWLTNTKVDFVCNNCPNRTAKNIAFMTLEVEAKAAVKDDDDDIELDEVPEDLD